MATIYVKELKEATEKIAALEAENADLRRKLEITQSNLDIQSASSAFWKTRYSLEVPALARDKLECPICFGRGQSETQRWVNGKLIITPHQCVDCNGTGKLIRLTKEDETLGKGERGWLRFTLRN